MTASAKIRGADKVVASFGDKMMVLEMDEAKALHEDLSRILGVSDDRRALDEVIGRFSKMCDVASAEAMKLQRRVRG